MAYRCPYCRQQITEWPSNRCPLCRRGLRPPGAGQDGLPRGPVAAWRPPVRRPGGGTGPKIMLPGRRLPLFLAVAMLLLAGWALVQRARQPHARDAAATVRITRENLTTLAVALDLLREDCGRYPNEREGLAALMHDPGMDGWQGPYIVTLMPDPWGHPFRYQPRTDHVILSSHGADGLPGTSQDIVITGRPGIAHTPAQLWIER